MQWFAITFYINANHLAACNRQTVKIRLASVENRHAFLEAKPIKYRPDGSGPLQNFAKEERQDICYADY